VTFRGSETMRGVATSRDPITGSGRLMARSCSGTRASVPACQKLKFENDANGI
jgi:hypothetical protein